RHPELSKSEWQLSISTSASRPGKRSPGVDTGFPTSITLSAGSSLSTKTDMKVSHKDSTATLHKEDVTVEGLIGDNVKRGYQPLVEVYQDSIFGSLMYRRVPGLGTSVPLGPRFACTGRGPFRVNDGRARIKARSLLQAAGVSNLETGMLVNGIGEP